MSPWQLILVQCQYKMIEYDDINCLEMIPTDCYMISDLSLLPMACVSDVAAGRYLVLAGVWTRDRIALPQFEERIHNASKHTATHTKLT